MAHRGQNCLEGRTTINGLTDSETEASMDASTACSTSTVGEETAACRAFRASLTAVWILESSLSMSWSIQAGSAPSAEGPGVLVSWRPSWHAERRTWSGRPAVPLMPWPGCFSSLGVSLASDNKATQGELDTVTMK